MTRAPLLEIAGLSVGFGGGAMLRDVGLTLARGEVLALVGESGSGKTTIARAVTGMLAPTARIMAGRIGFDGADLARLAPSGFDRIRGRRIGWVPQDPMVALNPLRPVVDTVIEPLVLHGLAQGAAARTRAITLLDQVGLTEPERVARLYPHQISGGMRQRVLIAAALAAGPDLLIADEPTTALDVTVQKLILDDIGRLVRDRGLAMLLITHDLALAADRADRIAVLHQGRIVETGSAPSVLARPREAYTKLLLASAPDLTRPVVRPVPPPADAIVLQAQAVSRSFADGAGGIRQVLDGVTLTLPRGLTVGLVGESGSGKTTLARMLLGLTPCDSGRVVFDGQDLAGLDRAGWRAFRRRVQPVYQSPFASLDPRLPVGCIIAEPLIGHRLASRRERPARVTELLDMVELPRALAARRPQELSGGQRQRVAIARALAAGPEVIILDEPVSALDVSIQAKILDLLTRLQRALGLSYLFISHDLAVIREIADEVAVMSAGRIVESGPVAPVFATPAHAYTRTLLAAVPGQCALSPVVSESGAIS